LTNSPTNLSLMVSRHFKAHTIAEAKGGRHRGVCGVATASRDDAADARMVLTRVFRVPAPSQKDLQTGAEIHWNNLDRVAGIAGAIAGGNIAETLGPRRP
jgi:hypothetical protein